MKKFIILLISVFLLIAEDISVGQQKTVPVTVEHVQVKVVNSTNTYTGEFHPVKESFLSVDEAGRIKELFKQDGDSVKKGQLLAQVTNPSLEGKLEIAKATIKEALARMKLVEKKLERQQAMFSENLISVQQFEDVKFDFVLHEAIVQTRTADINRLQSLIDSFSISAPFDGQIIASPFEAGQWITPSSTVFHIVNYETLELNLGIPGKLLGSVPLNREVAVLVKDTENKLRGRIVAVMQHVNKETGNFLVKVEVKNSAALPLSGLLANVEIPIGQPAEQVLVSRDAIVRKNDKTYVVVSDKGIAKIISVQVDRNHGSHAIVTAEGLADGALVVVRGNERLLAGTPLLINKEPRTE
jgi:membrane fusion protein (multidrug efflux system)